MNDWAMDRQAGSRFNVTLQRGTDQLAEHGGNQRCPSGGKARLHIQLPANEHRSRYETEITTAEIIWQITDANAAETSQPLASYSACFCSASRLIAS